MIYLATPYSRHPEIYYPATRKVAAEITLTRGYFIFSPILHWHDTAINHDLPRDADFWWDYNRHMLSLAERLIVATFPGWDVSRGVQMEMTWWNTHRIDRPLDWYSPSFDVSIPEPL